MIEIKGHQTKCSKSKIERKKIDIVLIKDLKIKSMVDNNFRKRFFIFF